MRQLHIRKADWIEEGEELTLTLYLSDGRQEMEQLLDGATQLDLSFSGTEAEGKPYLEFILRSGNGELAILLPSEEWENFLDEPDLLVIDYGKEPFKMKFLPTLFLRFIDRQIERVNQGEDTPFLREVIRIFAEDGKEG